jgi:hypothetical protein
MLDLDKQAEKESENRIKKGNYFLNYTYNPFTQKENINNNRSRSKNKNSASQTRLKTAGNK